jgi:UDP-GlcNAc:undecaprenyl-phosphate GlcNAc-1-phosphate transferase
LAALSILAPARFATALLVLAVPITDTFWRILMRIRSGRSPLHGDRGHLHFRLLDHGYRQNRIVLGYWVLCAVLGLLSLLPIARIYKLGTLAAVLAGASIALAWLSRPQELTPAQPPQERLE